MRHIRLVFKSETVVVSPFTRRSRLGVKKAFQSLLDFFYKNFNISFSFTSTKTLVEKTPITPETPLKHWDLESDGLDMAVIRLQNWVGKILQKNRKLRQTPLRPLL